MQDVKVFNLIFKLNHLDLLQKLIQFSGSLLEKT